MKPSQINDYYERLGISRDASENEIRLAYRRLVLEYHPDRNGGSKESHEELVAVNEAYEVLSDSNKRKSYDTPSINATKPDISEEMKEILEKLIEVQYKNSERIGKKEASKGKPGSRVRYYRDTTLEEFIQAYDQVNKIFDLKKLNRFASLFEFYTTFESPSLVDISFLGKTIAIKWAIRKALIYRCTPIVITGFIDHENIAIGKGFLFGHYCESIRVPVEEAYFVKERKFWLPFFLPRYSLKKLETRVNVQV
ncbi:J domain-containing protein [Candidatus Woesearchaeota archaeon]|nr:J domain-containing protein [Candidatus Woesearchaeota archaeon]